MINNKRVGILPSCLLLVALVMQGSASAATSPVLLYDADQSTTTGSTPSVLSVTSSIIPITDVSSAGNNGRVGSGTSGFNATAGSIETVEDDPLGVTGELSFMFGGGDTGRINTDAIDLLTDTLIASNGGYTFDTWVKVPELPPPTPVTEPPSPPSLFTLISFAGTEQITINEFGQLLNVNKRGGDSRAIGPAGLVTDGEWHRVIVRFDTSKDTDGSAGSNDNADGGNLVGNISAVVDGVHYDVGTGGTGTFGDTLDRNIGVGGHPQGFALTSFKGLLYDPSVSLGVDEAFGGIRLYVNRETGEGHLVHFGDPAEVDAYTIESAGETDIGPDNSLDPDAWSSLQDQNFDGSTSPGDFDNDGGTDGADFLVWQRGEVNGSGSPQSDDLALWEDGYGGSGGASPWSESGTPSDALLAETSLESSIFDDDQSFDLETDAVSLANSVSLGNLFVVGEDEDLSFSYHVEGEENNRVGLIVYFTPPAETSVAASTVPEPTSALILLLGITATSLTRFGRGISI